MPHSVFQVADFFLQKESMEQKKLQKLCYYAQAWSYALLGQPLIHGSFEAWVHGPVNRTLWNDLRNYGYHLVEKDHFRGRLKESFSEEEQTLLESVWVTYGPFSGWQLERLTHTEAPWLNAREGLSEFEPSNREIDPCLMRNYYAHLYAGEDGVGE